MSVSGSIRKFMYGGITYDVAADSNLEFIPSIFEKENIATSGDNMTKLLRRSQDVTGIDLIITAQAKEILQAQADLLVDAPVTVELASGNTYTTVAQINFETWSTEENRATVSILPRNGTKPWALV